jgi:hypothetical protein
MRRHREHFGDRELTLIYIARKLSEALQLESVLSDAGFDYLVEPDTYRGGFLFRTERVGAFFYVAPEDDEVVSALLERRGFTL